MVLTAASSFDKRELAAKKEEDKKELAAKEEEEDKKEVAVKEEVASSSTRDKKVELKGPGSSTLDKKVEEKLELGPSTKELEKQKKDQKEPQPQ